MIGQWTTYRLVVAMLVSAAMAGPAAAQQAFIEGLPDVPLMPGLAEDPERRLVFDKPSGGIFEAVLTGPVNTGAAVDFYDRALTELGWRAESGDADAGSWTYQRNGDQLQLRYLTTARGLEIRLFLTTIDRRAAGHAESRFFQIQDDGDRSGRLRVGVP